VLPKVKHLLSEEGSPDQIAVAGDWHGNLAWATRVLNWVSQQGIRVLVHTGDFGFWCEGVLRTELYLDGVNKVCEELDMVVLWVDGNHEDHERLHRVPVDESMGVRVIRDRVIHLPRGFRWTWHGKKWLALGGAASVDKNARIEGRDWWPGEVISSAEAERVISEGRADVMVTHDAPDRVNIPGITDREHSPFTPEIQRYADNHRALVGAVVDEVKPTVLFHGHMHRRYQFLRVTDTARTLVVGLDCDGSTLDDNVRVVSLVG
jgi:predicted phosphodiesterase